ncbi:MAG TPA: integration host factor subunit alpha [Deltaproteobacteria bacterium]|nr:integration host factor subunit alpha [Deltaproteobacteria bacterium]
MAVTKANLIDSVYEKSGLQKQQSTSAVESLLEIMKRTLTSGEDILIIGFGKFYVKDKNERKGRNPHTGNGLMLDARRVVKFRCSDVMKDKVNGEGNDG